MRKFLSLIVAIAILFGVYSSVFGLPDRVAALINANENSESGAQNANNGAGAAPQGGGGRRGGGNQATTVVTVPLELLPYETVLNAIGTATALRSADVVSAASGEVVEVNLNANTYVETGAVLMRLDSRTEELNLEIAQAQLDQATESVALYERLRAYENTTVTEMTLSEALINQRVAQANVGLAQIALDDRTVRAPISGKLGLSDVEIGDLMGANDVIVTIDSDDALLVTFELPERAIGILTEVNTIFASTPTFTGQNFNGEVISFDSRLDSVTRSVTVNARIENENGALWPGMTFAVRMLHESDPLPAVPSTAITWSRDGSNIWLNVDGRAKQVPVTILFRRDNTVWIDGDVPAGTQVVSEGAQKLRDGSSISTPNSDRPRTGQRPADAVEVGADQDLQAAPKPNATEEPT